MGSISIGALGSFDLDRFVRELADSSDNVGCVLLFVGSVRAEGADGNRVQHLHYESYVELAERELERIVRDAERDPNVYSVGIHHASGDIPVSGFTFIVGVAAKHRKEGFRVLEAVVNRVKAEVHIWKKEVTDGGEYWIH